MNKETRWLLEEKYHGKETSEFFADIKRLEAGEPLAYIIGWVDFLGCRIDLSVRSLIPRPETEFWVEGAIKEISNTKGQIKILDLFSGSGCIGVALAKQLPNAIIDFGEKDPLLCEQITKNITQNNIEGGRIRVLHTDVFFNITDAYDYILANPPYIDPTQKDSVDQSVLLYEPHEALFADNGGLSFIQQLLTDGPAHLKPGGTLFIEFGKDQKEDIARLIKGTPWTIEFKQDQFGLWRIAKLRMT
jgi:release factor glutamine methyltransferase